ncbi:hypothetical protein [Saccharothrix carnea]|nr:hypothetical protein [Saccharothrix carnea]
MSNPDTTEPRSLPPQPEPTTTTTPRRGNGLLATAILFAGIGGGLLAWHPWDENTVQVPPAEDPHRITIQKVGEQTEAGESEASKPVYCLTNETGGLYCVVMPNRYTALLPEE